MLRISGVVACVLALAMGGIDANAEPQRASVVGERQRTQQSIIDRAQFDDGGRCFNLCFSGRTARRCQAVERSEKANCCNSICDRRNNWFDRSWY
jgi:hypothetical protein